MITNEILKSFKDYGLNLTPVGSNKSPITKNGKWAFDWTDHDLLNSQRIGVYHKESQVYDVDFDDKNFIAHKFISLLPDTLTIGKEVNGKIIATHKIYGLPKGFVATKYSYPKSAARGNTIIELLPSTQTIIAGVDRKIIHNIKPTVVDPSIIQQYVRLIVCFSELYKFWPNKNEGKRDEAHLRLAGALARETDIPLNLKEEFVSKLCELTNDNEIKNRVNKLSYQEEQFKKNPEDVYGVKSLSEFLNANLPGFDEIKRLDQTEDNELKSISFSPIEDFLTADFPQPKYIIEPYVAEQTIIQIVGASGVGKTMWGLTIAGSIACGSGLLEMPSINGARPILYIEGELPSSDVQTRINGMINKLNLKIKNNFFNVATLQQQLQNNDGGFTPIQTEKGLKEIELAMLEIKKRTGKMPVVFIDNISCLAPGLQENDAHEWSPIINKFVKWKNMGSTIFYFHHLNKGGDASGSTMQHRTIDMVIRMRKPDHKQKIRTFEEQGVQAIVDFPKWRLHDNSKHAQEHMLVCENWKWEKLPVLSSDELEIKKMVEEGLSVKEMKDKISLAEKTIYKKIKELKDKGIISDVEDDEEDIV